MSGYHTYPGECAKCDRAFTDRAADLDQALDLDDLCRNCSHEQHVMATIEKHKQVERDHEEALREDYADDVRRGLE